MAYKENLFDNFANGTAITNATSDDQGGAAFTNSSPGAGGSYTITTADFMHGNASLEAFVPSGVAGQFDIADTASADAWTDFGFKLRAYPTVTGIQFPVGMRSSTTALCRLEMSNTGQLRIVLGAGSAYGLALALDVWYRIQIVLTGVGTASTSMTYTVFVGNSTTVYDTATITGATTVAQMDRFRYMKTTNVASDASCRFDTIRQNIGSSTPPGPYQVPITSDLDLRWVSRMSVSSDSDIRWKSAVSVSSDLDTRWAVRSGLNSDVNLPWTSRAQVPSNVDLRWAARSTVSSDLDQRWAVRAQVGSSVDLRWAVVSSIAQVTSDVDLRWVSRTQALSDLNPRWAVRTVLSSDVQPLWVTRSQTLSASDIRWAVRAALSSDLSALWGVRGAASSDSDVRWRVRAALASDLGLIWSSAGQAQLTFGVAQAGSPAGPVAGSGSPVQPVHVKAGTISGPIAIGG